MSLEWLAPDLLLLDPWFLLGIPVALLVLMVRRRRPRAVLPVPSAAAIRGLPRTVRQRLAFLPLLLRLVVVVVLSVALARPAQREVLPVEQEGRDILLVLDTSGSMVHPDMGGRVRRIDAAVRRAREFVGRRSHDRIGLMTFALHPEVRCPPTLDRAALDAFLDGVGLVPQQSVENETALGVALARAVTLLEGNRAAGRVVVLISDGGNTVADLPPEAAARLAAGAGVRVHTIGIGTVERRGGREHPIDFSGLERIAATTGGRFFRARRDADLAEVYEALDAVEPTPVEALRHRTVDVFPPVLAAGMLALLLALSVELLWIREAP